MVSSRIRQMPESRGSRLFRVLLSLSIFAVTYFIFRVLHNDPRSQFSQAQVQVLEQKFSSTTVEDVSER